MKPCFLNTLKTLCMLVLLALVSFHVYAYPVRDGRKVVRVGWHESPFNITDSLGHRSGYGYDYQRRIAAFTGWTYEYVYGSWSELYEQLLKGELDLLSDVSLTPQRQGKMLFSRYPMGKEDYFLVVPVSHPTIRATHLSTLNGMRIAVNQHTIQADMLRTWLRDNNIQAEVIESPLEEAALLDEFKAGKFDALVNIDAYLSLPSSHFTIVSEIGATDFHFAVSRQRPDLLEDLDNAMSQIVSQTPFYDRKLYERYFNHADRLFYLSKTERLWLQHHGPVRVGYSRNFLPLCDTDSLTGNLVGILGDLIARINLIDTDLSVEPVDFPTTQAVHDALLRGKIDVAFPNGLADYDNEKLGLNASEPLLNSYDMAIVRNKERFDASQPQRAAVVCNSISSISTIERNFPHWQIVELPNADACFKAIADGKADVFLLCNFRMGTIVREMRRYDLKGLYAGSNSSVCFAVRESDPVLYSIINRLLPLISEADVQSALGRYANGVYEPTWVDFVRAYAIPLLLLLLAVIGLITGLFINSRRSNRRAQLANNSKTRFLFNMSHDIRTPMNAIIGYAKIMRKHLDNPQQIEAYLDKVDFSSNFLMGLLNNVLEMSRIESGKVELDEKPYFISEIADEISLIYADLMAEKGITFSFGSNTEHSAIYCDKTKLKEVYLNLLSNAYKYTPAGGSVTIFVEEVPHPKAGYINMHASVIDTGQGMSPEYLPHLFEDFTREKTFTDNKIPGTGLGMSIVKRIVDLMGGTISVESKLGQRTTFTFTEGTEKD
ncbi:MAG: transporter substrate-binding domain-containing protein [Bacteroidales bacterium]|nr:transporter substrate-binding domain-containing protein [Bacteroidales bacterium]